MRLRIDCAYDGADFSGWAAQPGRRTVQGTLEAALTTVLRVPQAAVVCAGRTDTGVHARASHAWGRSYSDVVRGFRGRFDHPPDVVARPRDERRDLVGRSGGDRRDRLTGRRVADDEAVGDLLGSRHHVSRC